MKYIYYIAAILTISLALIIFQYFTDRPATDKQPAIVINDRVITVEELAKLRPPHDESRQDFINSIITKELLIQEAQRSGIDKEELFRRSIQSFYEQSLVKVLMDRKFASLNIVVSDEEVEQYHSMFDKKVSLTIYKGAKAEDLNTGAATGEKMIVSFRDLSRNMKLVVSLLKKGEKSRPFISGSEYVSIALDDIQPNGVRQSGMDRDGIRKLIAEEKREQMISEWMEGLRKKAKIKVQAIGTNGG
jgi:hypothetical protein